MLPVQTTRIFTGRLYRKPRTRRSRGGWATCAMLASASQFRVGLMARRGLSERLRFLIFRFICIVEGLQNARGVAQLGSVLRSGRRGRGFKSRHPDCLFSQVVACLILCYMIVFHTSRTPCVPPFTALMLVTGLGLVVFFMAWLRVAREVWSALVPSQWV